MTRVELAKQADISPVFLGKIEQGAKGPSPATLVRLAGALGMTAVELTSRAALLQAGSAATDEEFRASLMRAIATGGAAAILPGSIVTGLLTGAVTHTAMRRRERQFAPSDDPARPGGGQPAPDDPREELIDLIGDLSDEEVAVMLRTARRSTASRPEPPS